jgi:hypothetical protein
MFELPIYEMSICRRPMQDLSAFAKRCWASLLSPRVAAVGERG